MAKRKRTNQAEIVSVAPAPVSTTASNKKQKSSLQSASKPAKAVSSTTTTAKQTSKQTSAPSTSTNAPFTIQIVTGSYDRILHGITASITPSSSSVSFADTFLFNAHTSAIRTLALSPPSAPVPNQLQKIILATGSTDERVNLYHLSCHAPSRITVPAIPSLTSRAVVENPQNKELGSLGHHGGSVTKLWFAGRGKLLSSAEDSTIAVTRTRDWSLLSTIKAPIPKAIGRPSGDTAPVGGAPSGVNDFAVHPSMKLMISVGKSEKCMRLWNLVTGKKAGALTFERDVLNEVGEGRWSSGEGRKVVWDTEGEEFAVVFERGAVVFGVDCKIRCKVVTERKVKIHQVCYVEVAEEKEMLAISTEDGRILFFSTREEDLSENGKDEEKETLKSARLVAQLGGKAASIEGRIKDFSVLKNGEDFVISTANSEGVIKVWSVGTEKLSSKKGDDVKQVGNVLGTLETNNRVTCLVSYAMLPAVDGDGEVDGDGGDEDEGSESESGSDDE